MRSLLFVLATILISSCKIYKTAPLFNELPYHTKGSHVVVYYEFRDYQRGELIAIESDCLLIIDELKEKNSFLKIDKDKIKRVKVVLSQTHSHPNYRQSQAIGIMALGHGWWGIFTLPINLAVLASANKTFKQDVPWDELPKFARFPQGIPEGLALEDILPR